MSNEPVGPRTIENARVLHDLLWVRHNARNIEGMREYRAFLKLVEFTLLLNPYFHYMLIRLEGRQNVNYFRSYKALITYETCASREHGMLFTLPSPIGASVLLCATWNILSSLLLVHWLCALWNADHVLRHNLGLAN